MTVPIFLYGSLASQRRGRVLRDSVAASNTQELPPRGVVLVFGEDFQSAPSNEQGRFIGWTRTTDGYCCWFHHSRRQSAMSRCRGERND